MVCALGCASHALPTVIPRSCRIRRQQSPLFHSGTSCKTLLMASRFPPGPSLKPAIKTRSMAGRNRGLIFGGVFLTAGLVDIREHTPRRLAGHEIARDPQVHQGAPGTTCGLGNCLHEERGSRSGKAQPQLQKRILSRAGLALGTCSQKRSHSGEKNGVTIGRIWFRAHL